MKPRRPPASRAPKPEPPVLEGVDASLLDIVDHVLTKGIVVTGDLVLGVADIDLVYLRLSAVLCAADRVLGADAGAKKRRSRASPAPPSAAGDPLSRNALLAARLGTVIGRGAARK